MDYETLLQAINDNREEAIRRYARTTLSSLIIKELYEKNPDNQNVQVFLASYQEVPSKILEELAENITTEAVLLLLVANPRTPRTTLKFLAETGAPNIRKAVAENKMFSPQTANLLAKDECREVRRAVAENPMTPLRILLELARDPENAVRSALFTQKKLDQEVYNILLNDSSPLIRSYAATKAELTEEQLLRWADSDCLEQQIAVLQRANLTDQVLESLSFSPFEKVQIVAFSRRKPMIDEMLYWLENGTLPVKVYIAKNLELPEDLQMVAAVSQEQEVRQALAVNPKICEKVALFLLHGSDREVLMSLADNTEMSARGIIAIAQLAIPEVNKILTKRRDLPEETIQIMLSQGDEKVLYHLAYHQQKTQSLPPEIIERFTRHSMPIFRKMVAAVVDDYRLQLKLVYDPSEEVREALRNNPKLDHSLLEFLSKEH